MNSPRVRDLPASPLGVPLHFVAAELVQCAACNHGARVLHRDYETRSQATLKTIGTSRYASNSSTTVLCCAYAVDDQPVQLWTPGNPIPAEFVEAATNPAWIVCAHGAHFEDAIERHVLHPRFDWPVFPVEPTPPRRLGGRP
jgi:hypothetical protein